ncbi:tRNA (cytosine(72)-C(5))-methyltransferase NSUN6 [Epargyreus clarus]|uniref:tRNA (cytosine(72)-C(5))-methyltransferase NSUN6 n=1 Tax=Epargyreus clarus TaxID=520877 RepID=UPI003C2FB8BF
MHSIQNWLSETPKYTTFRINKLKGTDLEKLTKFLTEQNEELNAPEIPKFYFLKPDCLILEQWMLEPAIATSGKEVIVDALCAAAVLRGAHVFAPGVLGLLSDCKMNDKVDIYGDLEGKCKRGLKIPYTGRKRFVGVGYLKMLRCDLFDKGVQPSGIAVHTILPESRLPVVNETLFPKGEVLLQNLPSIVTGWVVNALPNENILDMCAAPGNKTTHLAEMSDNKAHIIALDKTEYKVKKIKQNCESHGITCVEAFSFDSTMCYSEDHFGEISKPPFPRNCFDKVLLDAPCSGLGQRPQLVSKMDPKTIDSYKYLQRKLFTTALKVLKTGGKLIYSTCTVTLDENEGMVLWALEKFPCLKLVPAEPLLGGPGLDNVGLSNEQRMMVQRFGPENDSLRPTEDIYKNTIGFFIAIFTKIHDIDNHNIQK